MKDLIIKLLDENNVPGKGLDNEMPVKDAKLPVIFIGKEPRFVGYAKSFIGADMKLIENELSSTNVSKATIAGDNRFFYVAHG